MMQALREGNKPVFYLIIFFFIVGFIFLDIGGGAVGCNDAQRRIPNALALVNEEPITYQAYQQTLQLALNQRRGSSGNDLSDGQVIDLEAQTYHQLVEDTLIRQAAEARGLGTDLDEVIQVLRTNPPPQIQSSPLFQTDGQFDMSKYYQALADQRFLNSLVGNYLADLPRTKLNDEIGSTAKVSALEVLETHASRKQQATISFVRVRPASYGPSPATLDPSQVQSWYASNRDNYTLDDAVVASWLRVPRTPSRIDSVEAREVIDSIFAEVQSGEPFDELLDIHSNAAVSMRGGPRGSWLRSGNTIFTFEMQQAVEGLGIGEFSQPYLDLYGWHVVQVDSLRTADDGTPEFRLKDIQIPVEISPTTEQAVERRMTAIWETLRSGADMAAVADTAGLTVQTTQPIDLDAPRAFIPGLPNYIEIENLLRAGEVGTYSEIIKGSGGWFLFRVDSRGRHDAPPLQNIEPQVRGDMVTELGKGRADELSNALASALGSGADLEGLAAVDSSLTVGTTRPFVRYYRIPEIGREPGVTGAAFAAPIGEVVGPIVSEIDGSHYFLRVDERDDSPTALQGTERDDVINGLRASVETMKRNEILGSFLKATRDAADIDDYRQVRTGTTQR